ncbi:polysaccharide pyruvyl transferase family protein [Microbacterium sp. NPDC077391]|uniref:polysaccharide pyruvyl transferase family protein n=1 Tax=Microbacterium sp. NPDC077391 TaxID=3154765 RepID=UPI0034343F00
MKSQVFISMTGPDGNLGDVLIRRLSLDWVRRPGGLVAFVGNHNDSWIRAIGFDEQDRLVTGGGLARAAWMLRAALGRSKPIFVTDPGEVWVGRHRLPHHLFQLATGLIVKARGGKIIIPPHALAQHARAERSGMTLRLHRKFSQLADVCLWREQRSLDIVGVGVISPDIGFSDAARASAIDEQRRTLIISLRGDRPFPSTVVLQAIIELARTHSLEIVSLSQVDVDDDRARSIADHLGIRSLVWDPRNSGSEEQIRGLYDNAALVISDRLHVLVLGLISGAMPVELAEKPERKIAAHFATVGLPDISMDTRYSSVDEVTSWLRVQLSRRVEALSVLDSARERLRVIRAQVVHAVDSLV